VLFRSQHIGHALRDRGFKWLIMEQGPRELSPSSARKFNYGVFSARTGNIYTVSLLKQWVDWATKEVEVPHEVWENNGRFYDPFRPNIEPNGFSSKDEVCRSRAVTIGAFRACLKKADIFVFTLGLTESWHNIEHGYEYPLCPGTVAGEFDETKHAFVNQEFPFILKTLGEVIRKIATLNPKLRFILTVSPVPLTATMSGNHVLLATTESKSTLRAVAGTLCRRSDIVDYFPSLEIISGTPFRGSFFAPNQRSVNAAGVESVMNSLFFLSCQEIPIPRFCPNASLGSQSENSLLRWNADKFANQYSCSD